MVRGAVRRLLALAVVLMLPAAFPPWELPCYAVCLAPLVWMWRGWGWMGREGVVAFRSAKERSFAERKATVGRAAVEGVAIGFAAAWLSSDFLRDALWSRGWILQVVACLAFGLQLGVVTVAICETRHLGFGRAALMTATVATLAEWVQARWGVAWPVMGLSVAVAETPLAQWTAMIGPFGIAWVLYLANFLCVLSPHKNGGVETVAFRSAKERSFAERKATVWGPLVSAGLIAIMWWGGVWIESKTLMGPLPFSALLVQPRVLLSNTSLIESLQNIDRLTVANLKDNGPVDLVIWPEGCVLPSPHPTLIAPTSEAIPEDRWDFGFIALFGRLVDCEVLTL